MTIRRGVADLVVSAASYRLALVDGFPLARLEDAAGRRWADLALLSSIHTTAALDETARLAAPRIERDGPEWRIAVDAESSAWRSKTVILEGDDEELRFRWRVEGPTAGPGRARAARAARAALAAARAAGAADRGDLPLTDTRLTDVHLLGGYFSGLERRPTGFVRSGAAFDTLSSPEPSDPARLVAPAGEPASLDVLGGFYPGRGHWFFTPPPLCLALAREGRPPWLTLGLVAPAEDEHFTGLHFVPGERSFSLRLDYEGQTPVAGGFETPAIVFRFGSPNPYAAIAAHRESAGRLLAAGGRTDSLPSWWLEPMFCGWGAQAHLAATLGGRAPDYATQDRYDEFLATLSAHGLNPGTIVIDDKWQATYGVNEADGRRWPDLRGWIARRHEAGQRVLLWFKAWDPEGLPPELCVRNSAGRAIAADPSNPKYEEELRSHLWRMLGPDGYDADGLKVDFTAHTPSGPGLRRHGREWGISLLHRLLATLHEGAHRVKPDALVITHSPDPGFASVTDMIRLNDMMRLDEPDGIESVVDQMVHRARIVAAACPGVPIDTDDWSAPDRASWRRYQRLKPSIGVPALYYTTHIDRTGEALEDEDYELLRAVWAEARARGGRP